MSSTFATAQTIQKQIVVCFMLSMISMFAIQFPTLANKNNMVLPNTIELLQITITYLVILLLTVAAVLFYDRIFTAIIMLSQK